MTLIVVGGVVLALALGALVAWLMRRSRRAAPAAPASGRGTTPVAPPTARRTSDTAPAPAPLPLVRPAPQAHGATQTAAILVVDDSPIMRRTLMGLLGKAGY